MTRYDVAARMGAALAVAVLLPGPLLAQALVDGSKTSVTGQVVTTAGVPLQGYPVIIEAPTGGNIVALTGPDGRFAVDGLAPGSYTARPGTGAEEGTGFDIGSGGAVTLPELRIQPGVIRY